MSYDAPATLDPYSEAYTAPAETSNIPLGDAGATSDRRSRSPDRRSDRGGGSYGGRRRSPTGARRPSHAPAAPNPTNVLGVFGLSIRTTESDLHTLFSPFGPIQTVTIVYDQRQADRSRGFGFITMERVEDATSAIEALNGVSLNGRNVRVDYSVTQRPHKPTPGEYMGHRRSTPSYGGRHDRDGYDGGRSSYRDRDRSPGYRRDRDRSPYSRSGRGSHRRPSPSYRSGGGRDWRDRDRSPPRRSSRRSYSRSRSPAPSKPAADYDAGNGAVGGSANGGTSDRW